MSEQAVQIIIVENRRMIRDILVDILEARSYPCTSVSALADSRRLLAQDKSVALLMVDVGLLGGRENTLMALARMPELRSRRVVLFSCVESLGGPDVYLLRSPADFSVVADAVQAKLGSAGRPRLGELLVDAGMLSTTALGAVLVVQEELAKLGQQRLLGELLVMLGFVTQEDVTRALRAFIEEKEAVPDSDEAS